MRVLGSTMAFVGGVIAIGDRAPAFGVLLGIAGIIILVVFSRRRRQSRQSR